LNFLVCYCGRQDEVVRCGSAKAKRYNLSELQAPYDGDLELCDVEMFFEGTAEEKATLLSAPDGSLTALFVGTVFSCEQRCDRPLDCEHHFCTDVCHPGECKSCPLLPQNCVTCPCGRVPLSKLCLRYLGIGACKVMNGDIHGNRQSCTDPIPVCPNTCDRPNPICGHPCPEKCHQGPECPPCKLTTQINCRCGKSSKEIPCYQYALAVKNDPCELPASLSHFLPAICLHPSTSKQLQLIFLITHIGYEYINTRLFVSASIQFLCNRVCAKKKTCGRHKCNRKCCDMVIHSCQEICGRTLSCGKHTCEDRCHCGPCGSCWRGVIYEEIYCHCGYTCLNPPQPCGTKPPDCDRPCTRQHACTHEVRHNCHSDPECPKCTELTVKRCIGDHTWMYNVPCFITVITCGNICDKPITGCSHRCQRQCHAGSCLSDTQKCTQPCSKPRPSCGHPCGQPCHEVKGITCEVAYRNSKCQVLIALQCSCGFRKEEQRCCQVKGLVGSLSQKDPNFLLRPPTIPGLPFGLPTNEILPCDNSCAMAKRLAEGKSKGEAEETGPKMWPRGGHAIDEMQLSAFPPPEYPDNLKQYASNNSTFANTVEEVFCDIVQEVNSILTSLSPICKNSFLPNFILKALDSLKPNERGIIVPGKVITHNFNPMQKDKRWFIKELAEFYGIQCVEMDPKPNTFVQAMAKSGWAKFPGGTSKHNCVTLSKQIEASFVGTVKLNPNVQKPVHASQKPASLRCDNTSTSSTSTRRLLAFNAIASEASKTN
uniref:R3H domain-containing protein n=1 Tax=Rodentolepis nana TaxID=102285 RepID=A0A158QJ94_RODNA